MGIKGIYAEIGPGQRIALAKLAIEKFEQIGRPLRVAIDVSIWQFQTQAGQGGTNPALRTFYYRLLRLLSVSVQPLFVFDGPHKPKFKRNRRVGQGGAMVPNLLTKQLLKLFGFPFHMAPGEAEAECALLQKQGIVDAVLSEDVDTLMFGCRTTLRNWSAEGPRGNKTPTHVSLYDAKTTKEGKSGLDREGMVLIALMSGGDYITEGIPGCGIKIACEAARAGFGKSLCAIPRSDDAAYCAWRTELVHEVQTNESKYFRMKHKNLNIPEDFPNKEVLGYYTHPVVSSESKLEKLKEEVVWDGGVDVQGLRTFVGDAFEWTHKIGATKFIRGLAPVLLTQKLRMRADRRASGYGDLVLTAMNEMELVRGICGQRQHFSTDGISELRVSFNPNDIVGIDLDAEQDDAADYGRDGLAPSNEDDQIEAYASDDQGAKKGVSQYDPTQLDKMWISHTIAKVGVPLKVEDYEESLRKPKQASKKTTTRTSRSKKTAPIGGMQNGSLDRFVRVSKPSVDSARNLTQAPKDLRVDSDLPPTYLAPILDQVTSATTIPPPIRNSRLTRSRPNEASQITVSPKPKSKSRTKPKTSSQPAPNTNPWTIAQSQSSPQSAPRISQPNISRPMAPFQKQNEVIDLLSSSPEQPRQRSRSPTRNVHQPTQHTRRNARPLTPRKHSRSPTPNSSLGSDQDVDDAELPALPGTVTKTRGSKSVEGESLLLTPTSAEKDKPSPRKRRSPRQRSRSPSVRRSSELEKEKENQRGLQNTSDPIARVLDFTSPTQRTPAHENDKSSQPSPSQRSPSLSPSPLRRQRSTSISSLPDLSTHLTNSRSQKSPTSSSPTKNSPSYSITQSPQQSKSKSKQKPKPKKVLLLRESIGTFQEIDEQEWISSQSQEGLASQGDSGSGTQSQSQFGRTIGGRARGKSKKERKVYRMSQVEVIDLRDV